MKYVASCSFGKDSLASIVLAREHGEPLDEIVYSEVMFDRDISGEVPEHREFIYGTAIPRLEKWGYKVHVLRADKTFMDSFNHRLTSGKNKGKKRGFPYFRGCCINRDCKIPPITQFWKSQSDDVIQYVGIAMDETERLQRLRSGGGW